MSKDGITGRFHGRNSSKNSNSEANENDFENSTSFPHFPPPRTPLHSIPDPSQYQIDVGDLDLDQYEATRSSCHRIGDPGVGSNLGTPRVSGRGKVHSEPNSAQSTPMRSYSRIPHGGVIGASSGSRASQRVSRGNSAMALESLVQVPHFELVENPLFWRDHNVQVLIRIRPLSTMEKVSQGYSRCLRQERGQSLVWLGHPETRFTFDHIACETTSQEKLFKVAGLPMVENCMSGYNSCMFAYGQTGSGKTFTMMGEITGVEGKLSEDCGITPRIFEYLFTRIRVEEENRRDENLKYSCKCSFLEIYNEQITDLLEPSSTNLQLREDLKKGIYVENLVEYNVTTVNDVLKLLLQGAANRKMAATHMNSESSRSHSVFTCIIESRWEKDSMTHFRFGRLNLVDLAGSERQKSSGAEGDRLKEAANINRSLSTLGLVIMSLVDLAHGKPRHVPYRDSRLTFLLQDSLGGNSKTTIIANVSPSICSASETLSTLKFAQRAKLIRNNAKVNEDASGDVMALQQQIQQLKGQLSFLLNHHNFSISFPHCFPSAEKIQPTEFLERNDSFGEGKIVDMKSLLIFQKEKMKCLEATLVGALRREKMAEAKVKSLEAEIECMKHLAHEREEDFQHSRALPRLREEKQLQDLADGLVSADKYLMDENNALSEEIQMLQARINRNSETASSELDNIGLLEQLQLDQDFYEQGEQETLSAEVSELQDQDNGLKELIKCKNMNSDLLREVDELQTEVRKFVDCSQASSDAVSVSLSTDPEEFKQVDKHLMVGRFSPRIDTGDNLAFHNLGDDESLQNEIQENLERNMQKELLEARLLVEALEIEQIHLMEKLQKVQEENLRYKKILSNKHGDHDDMVHCLESTDMNQNNSPVKDRNVDAAIVALQAQLDRMTKDLEEARLLNNQYQEHQALQLSHQQQVEVVCDQVEMEMSKTILHLQEEVGAMQLEFQERLNCITHENTRLKSIIAAKEEEIRGLSSEWENATLDLMGFLVDGCKSLKDASGQIKNIAGSFPQTNIGLNESVMRAVSACVEKEERILQLHKSLEDAQKLAGEMEIKLISLKGATIALAGDPQLDDDEHTQKQSLQTMLLEDKTKITAMMERKSEPQLDQIPEEDKYPNSSFFVGSSVSICHRVALGKNNTSHTLHSRPVLSQENSRLKTSELKTGEGNFTCEDIDVQIEMQELKGWLEAENVINSLHAYAETCFLDVEKDIQEVSSVHKELLQNLVQEICGLQKDFRDLNEKYKDFGLCSVVSLPLDINNYLVLENPHVIMHEMKVNLAELIFHLDAINAHVNSTYDVFAHSLDDVDHANGRIMCLRREFRRAFLTFMKLHVQFSKLVDDKESGNCFSPRGKHIVDCVAFTTNNQECVLKGANRLTLPKVEIGSYDGTQLVADERHHQAISFFCKCAESFATMKDADFMLNILRMENENAKDLTHLWRQAGGDVMEEKGNLIEEIEKLKSLIHLKEGENEFLRDQLYQNSLEIAESITFIEESFQQMQKDVDKKLKIMHFDTISMVHDMLNIIHLFSSKLEDIYSEILAGHFTLFALSQCYIGVFLQNITSFNQDHSFLQARISDFLPAQFDTKLHLDKGNTQGHLNKVLTRMEDQNLAQMLDNLRRENLVLKRKLNRKEAILKGVFFDFSLLQESASNKNKQDERAQNLIVSLNQVQQELEDKSCQLDNLLIQHRELESRLTNTETALFISNSDLEQARVTLDNLAEKNEELRMLVKDLYLRKSEAEEQLDEQKEMVRGLEKEILRLTPPADQKLLSSIEDLEEELRRVTSDRDCLQEKESEASKLYAEQKEEEIRILEHSVEELESTINVLEKKVHELDQEMERHRSVRESLEQEVLVLRHRILTVECITGFMDSASSRIELENEGEISRSEVLLVLFSKQLLVISLVLHLMSEFDCRIWFSRSTELHEAQDRIRVLEEERASQDKEIKQCKEYISELVLHAEAQASQYQQKYRTLEAMVREVKADASTLTCSAPSPDRSERCLTRNRGSSSPFRCITNLVQQMTVEKDQELSVAQLRIDELEALATNRHKEICMLNARLAAAESMTHDVIRDLLGVKLDITNYANLIEQHQVKKIVEAAQLQIEDSNAKDQEILKLRRNVDDLVEEQERSQSDILALQMTVEQLQEHHHLLIAQNEMLKLDKTTLRKRIVELDEMAKSLLRMHDMDLAKKLAESEALLSRVNDELAQYRQFGSRHANDRKLDLA
ncbi:Kinesin motor domain [Dillenia turbinata]|uniref:Kinesin motor domain n=1 Tax=Dillenia turbinata TaxID=194707 RepID=A0AAN8UDV5_9MAGN